MKSENFINRSFHEVADGEYDENGFYYTPNGSFWDPDGVYFNKEGFDCHKGYYNNHLEYIPGPGWIDELLCYEDEKEEFLNIKNFTDKKEKFSDEEIFDGDEPDDDDDDNLYEEIDYDKILEEEEKKFAKVQIEDKSLSIKNTSTVDRNDTDKKIISTESLFNKIPEDKIKNLNRTIEKNITTNLNVNVNKTPVDNYSKKEQKIEVDSLFL